MNVIHICKNKTSYSRILSVVITAEEAMITKNREKERWVVFLRNLFYRAGFEMKK